MRLIFAGTPEVAVPSLRAVHASGHEIVAVLTRQDAPLGRKRVLTPSPVAVAAEELGLPVIKADSLAGAVSEELAGLAPELGVIVAYGALLKEPALSTPVHGWINLHFSLLPAWRGAAPVQHAVIAGDEVTGMSVFQLVAELDAGPVFARQEHAIGRHQTSGHLLAELAEEGGPFLLSVVDGIAAGTAVAAQQQGEPSFAPKLSLVDGALDWTLPGQQLLHRLRGVTPEPGAHTVLRGERFKIQDAQLAHDAPLLAPGELRSLGGELLVGTGSVPLRLLTVQPAGKKAMSAADWWRGAGATLAAGTETVVFG